MFAGIPFNTLDGYILFFIFLGVWFHLQFLSCDFFLYFSTVRMICMFQSSKGFKRMRTCCLQRVEINVHTFLYV